jgi:hypothetical protein
VQRVLLRRHLEQVPVHYAATAFHAWGSTVMHAGRHLGQTLVITADIESFFDATPAWRVYRIFRDLEWDHLAASTLTGLCTYRGVLPQGAPTSPMLSNLVNRELDNRLEALVRRSGGKYTRYGDDLAFSWTTETLPLRFQSQVAAALLEFGYSLNKRKGWHLWRPRRGEAPNLTGITLRRDGHLHPDPQVEQAARKLRRKRHRDADDEARLRGYKAYLRDVRSI